MSNEPAVPVGIYEKALPAGLSWEEMLRLVRELGYDYLEISIDESEERLRRLEWGLGERERLRTLAQRTGVCIATMCLSGHRKYPMGGADPDVRTRAMQIMRDAIRFAVDVGIRIVQVAGYDVFYEPSTPDSQARFLDGLAQAVRWAGSAGVMLGLENVDSDLVDCMAKAMYYVNEIDSPWFQVMPDMGNFAAAGYHPPHELRLGRGHLVAVHVKDTLPGVFRGVPFEQGVVPLMETFTALAGIGFWGPMTVEMWSPIDPTGDPMSAVVAARKLVDRLIAAN